MHIRRLLLDVARRYWSAYAVLGLLALATGLTSGQLDLSIRNLFAASTVLAYTMALAAIGALAPREIRQLPVSRRELWRVGWILAVLVPAGLAGTIKVSLASAPVGFPLTAGHVLLSTSYDLLYCGLNGLLLARIPFTFDGLETWWQKALRVAAFVALAGGIGWPFLLSRVVPVEPTLVSLLVAMMLALLVTVVGYAHQPRATAHASRYVPPRAAAAPRPQTGARWQTGFALLAWHEMRMTLSIIAALLGAAVLYWWSFEPDMTLRDFANAGRLLPFAGLPADSGSFPMPFVMLMMLSTWFHRFTTDIRRFRVLPVSGPQLAGVLCGFSVMSAATIWLVLLVVHLPLVGSAPVTLRLDLFLVAASWFSLARTLELLMLHPLTSNFASGLAVVPALFVAGVASSYPAIGQRAALMTVGATVLALSFLLANWILQRSSRVYKRRPVWPPLANTQPRA